MNFRFNQAYMIATYAYSEKVRKENGELYIKHPFRVAYMVLGVAEKSNQEIQEITNLVCAAVLHDTVNDGVLPITEIEQIFGSKVRNLVDGCTDTPEIADLSGIQRKTAQAERLRGQNQGVQLIKLVDQFDNLEGLSENLENFKTDDAISRVEGMLTVARVCKEASVDFLTRAEKTAQDILDALSARDEVVSERVFQGDKQVCPHSEEYGEYGEYGEFG